MRAVNLIPSDQQRGAGGVAGKSGGAAYVLLGALALVVVLAAAYVHTGKSVDEKQAQLAQVTAQAQAAESQAQSLQSYTTFAAIRAKRVDTVTQLAASRFDWAHALREVARVLPENAWLTALTATTSPTVSVSGGTTGTLRPAINAPAIVVQGCTTSQASVSKLLARLRLIDGVQRVSLEDSTKGVDASAAGSPSPASGGSGDCRGGHAKYPQFNVDVFFNATSTVASSLSAPATASATGTATSATPATTTAPASTTVPASSTTGGTSK